MTVHGQRDVLDAAHVLAQVTEQLREFVRHGVTDGVRDVDRGRSGLDDRLDHLRQELELGARCVLGRELDVLAEFTRDLHAFDGAADDLALRHVQLVLAMDRTRGEEHVDAMLLRILQCLRRERDVIARAAGETADHGTFDLARHRIDGFPVAA